MVKKKISPKTFAISSPADANSFFDRNKTCRLSDTEKFIEKTIADYEKENNCTETSRRTDTTHDEVLGITIYTITCTFDSNQ